MEKESVNHILFDFYSIIDTDIGIARLMNAKYNNPAIVNPSVMGKDLETYKVLMINRKYPNPLIMFLNEAYRSEADGLYVELTQTDAFNEVLGMSITTSIFDILRNSMGITSALSATVLCWNEMQANYIKSLVKGIDVVIHPGDNTPLDITDYDTLIFKFPYPNLIFRCGDGPVNGKNIYICRYRFNMSEDDNGKLAVTDEVKLYHMNVNDFYVIEVYADASLNSSKEEISNGKYYSI